MKVFDYTGGKKGALLGDVARPSWMGGSIIDHKIYRNRDNRMRFQSSAGRSYKGKDTPMDIKELFGVDAVCFCSGQYTTGSDAGEWQWHTLYTDEGLKAAVAAGTVVYDVQPRQVIQYQVPAGTDRAAYEAALRVVHAGKIEIRWRTTPDYTGIGLVNVTLDWTVRVGDEEDSIW